MIDVGSRQRLVRSDNSQPHPKKLLLQRKVVPRRKWSNLASVAIKRCHCIVINPNSLTKNGIR